MEFGFITFDPLISPAELAENVALLARTDIICAPHPGGVEDRVERVRRYFAGDELTAAGMPLYRYVAYMATELEVLAHSRYADHLRRRRPDLLDGDYDPSFARHGVRYDDERIAEIANWCRVWTEAMFTPVYEARMTARTASADSSAVELVTRYRDATFTLLVQLTRALLPELDEQLAGVPMRHELLVDGPPHELLAGLAEATLPGRNPQFDLRLLGQRRNR